MAGGLWGAEWLEEKESELPAGKVFFSFRCNGIICLSDWRSAGDLVTLSHLLETSVTSSLSLALPEQCVVMSWSCHASTHTKELNQ